MAKYADVVGAKVSLLSVFKEGGGLQSTLVWRSQLVACAFC